MEPYFLGSNIANRLYTPQTNFKRILDPQLCLKSKKKDLKDKTLAGDNYILDYRVITADTAVKLQNINHTIYTQHKLWK